MPTTLHRWYPLVDYKMSSDGTECPSFVAALKLLQRSIVGEPTMYGNRLWPPASKRATALA